LTPFGGVSDVLLVTLARLSVVKFAIVATLSLKVLIAIVTELDLATMDKLGVISQIVLINGI
jgi:hypothetical protein